jgi:hypothetical protein
MQGRKEGVEKKDAQRQGEPGMEKVFVFNRHFGFPSHTICRSGLEKSVCFTF